MSISETTRRAGPYATDGVETEFPFTFKVFAEADVTVTSAEGGVETELALTTDYTVDLNADQDASPGGTVTLLEAPDGSTVTITSDMAATQPTVFTNQGGFYPRVLNNSLDRVTILVQQILEKLSRAALMPFDASAYENYVFGIEDGAPALLGPGSFVGDPGGNVLSVGLFAELATMTVGAGTDLVQTSGHTSTGVGAALYVRDGTSAVSTRGQAIIAAAVAGGVSSPVATASVLQWEAHWRKPDASGTYWTLYYGQRIESAMFGDVGGASGAGSGAAWDAQFTGPDNRLPIQAMIDWTIYWQAGPTQLCLSVGFTRLGDTIHLGYGSAFAGVSYHSIQLIGAGYGMYAAGPGCTTLVRNFAGKPLINVAGARGAVLDQFGVQHCLKKYRDNGTFAFPVYDEDNWIHADPETDIGRELDDRYSPDCAITIDGYAGAAPASPYPATTYPAWYAPGQTQYGKDDTSHDVSLFPTGGSFLAETNIVVTCPSGNIDANTDYIRMGHLAADFCKRVASITHTQHHGFAIKSIRGYVGWEIIANNKHGKRLGRIDGIAENCSYNNLAQLGTIGSSLFSGPMVFANPYVESAWRILNVSGGNSVEPPVCIRNASFTFDAHGSNASVPMNLIGKSATDNTMSEVPVVIDGGQYSYFQGVANMRAQVLCVNRPLFDGAGFGSQGGVLTAAARVFANGTAGGLVLGERLRTFGGRGGDHSSVFTLRELATGNPISAGPTVCERGYRFSSRAYAIPYWAPSVTPLNGTITEDIPNPCRRHVLDKTAFTSNSVSGAGGAYVWTFTNPTAAATVERFGGAAGDLLCDDATGVVFIVRTYDRATGVTTAEAMNGLVTAGGVSSSTAGFNPATGTVTAICLRNYVPEFPSFGTFTSASPDATAVQRGDGTAQGTAIAVGDYIDMDEYADRWLAPADSQITAFDSAAKTLSLAGNAGVSATRRLGVMTRTA